MSQTQVTQTDAMQDLSYLLGETSVPTTGTEDRQAFIQRSLERIYRYYAFPFSQSVATITMTSGVGSLPTDARFAPALDVRYVQSSTRDDHVYSQIPYNEKDQYTQSAYKYWLLETTAGVQTINTIETETPLSVRYSLQAPVINASIATAFPSSMVLAMGAIIYYRRAEDPLADTSVEEGSFMKELQEIIATFRRNRPVRRAIGKAEQGGYFIGQQYQSGYEDPNTSKGY